MPLRELARVADNRAWTRRASTFNELLVVIGIIALLLALLVPSLQSARQCARRVQCANNMHQWSFATQCYRNDYNDYLPTEGTYFALGKPYSWFNVLPPYLDAPSYSEVERSGKLIEEFPSLHVWICPAKDLSRQYKSLSGKNQFHYGMNCVLDGVGSPPDGGEYTPGFYDGFYYGDAKRGDDPISARHFSKVANTVFMFDIYSNISNGYQKNVATKFHGDFANVLFVDGRVGNCKADDLVTNHDFVHGDMIWDNPSLYWGYKPPPDDGEME